MKVTKRQAQVLTLYVKHGNHKAVARDLNADAKNISNIITRARKASGLPNVVVLAVQWDRYLRSQA